MATVTRAEVVPAFNRDLAELKAYCDKCGDKLHDRANSSRLWNLIGELVVTGIKMSDGGLDRMLLKGKIGTALDAKSHEPEDDS